GDLLVALGEAERAQLVSAAPGQIAEFHFTHVLMREVLYAELPLAERVELHRRAAETLERSGSTDAERLTEGAHHYYEAAIGGDRLPALNAVRAAAEASMHRLAYEEAAELYGKCLRLLELETAIDPLTCCELLLAKGAARNAAGEVETAKTTFAEAARLAEAAGSPERLAQAALGFGGFLASLLAIDPHQVELLDRALAALGPGGTPLHALLPAPLATAAPFLRGRGEAERQRRPALPD